MPIIQLALVGQGPVGADAVDHRPQHRAHAARHRARRGHPLTLTAASSARCRSISIRRRCRRAGFPARTSPTRSPRRTSITPVGTQKIGGFEYSIQLNNAPSAIQALGDLPIKTVNGAMVYIRDVAHVRDGNPPQTNIVHVDGNRSVLM